MRKRLGLLLFALALTSCGKADFTFFDIVGADASSIAGMSVTRSVCQSYAWPVDETYYSYLDCGYVLAKFDIEDEFFEGACVVGGPKDFAIVLHLSFSETVLDPYRIFYISWKTHYMYTYGPKEGYSYRSKNRMPASFINEVTRQ